MNLSKKISFDIVSLYAGNTPKSIELLIDNGKGQTTWVDSYGSIFYRDLQRGETPHFYKVDAQESYVHNGEKAVRVFKTISYWPAEMEGELSEDERVNNIIARHSHELFKKHQNVIVRGEGGGNINPNQSQMLLFELRETTKKVNDEVAKNKKVTEAMGIATAYYDENAQEFIDLCYKYGIQPVEGVPVEKLYNEMCIKLKSNPEHFINIVNHKDSKLLVMIKKALVYDENKEAIIQFNDPYYYMNGENIGSSDEEMIYNIKKSKKSSEFLREALGIPLEEEVEVTTLPKESDAIVSSKPSQDYQRRADVARIDEAKKAVNYIFTQWKVAKQKNPDKLADLEAKYGEKISDKRAEFIDVADAFDELIAKGRKYL